MMQQRLKKQQALMQQSLYHPALLALPQIEPILSGKLPPGFDSGTCRSVYVGNIHPQVTEPLLQEVFSSIGPLEGCKLIKKEKSSYGFVDYFDRRSAALAIAILNGRHLFGQPIKVNWAYTSAQREDTSIILTFLWVTSVQRLQMPHCMHAFQLTLAAWMQELCGIKKRLFKGVWICFLPQSAGSNMVFLSYILLLLL